MRSLKKKENEIFKLSFQDSDDCDLYFGFEFAQFFKMDFLIDYDYQQERAELYFQTYIPIPGSFGLGIFGIGLLLALMFLVYVVKSHHSFESQTAMKRERDLRRSLESI